ncbi:MAG: hypothetical protein IT385_08040 [Deltaproteobacteria bacterium]|nr:hypothetical protein [Deltaproteobacteria bacterium]
MQRVNFEPIPGTRFDQYTFKLRLVLGFITQPGGNKFKGFRDFMRKQNLWDKDKSEALFSLVEITWDKKDVTLGKTAKKLANAHSDVDFQSVLFERLKEVNLLLVKYVMEALDVQQGGRLHSVHELYRMITSYVYPGTYINLTSFQAWIDWMAATGFIKLVGIRWALSEKGQKVVTELRSMDVDEILEDMADDGEGESSDEGDDDDEDEDEDDEAPAPAPKKSAAAAPAPAPKAAATPTPKAAPADVDDDEDLFDDLPPEPEAPDDDAIAAASKRLGLDDEDEPPAEDVPKPARPKYTPPASLGGKKAAAAAAPAPAPKAGAPTAGAATSAAVHLPSAGIGLHVGAPVAFEAISLEDLSVKLLSHHRALGAWPALDAPTLEVTWEAGRGDMAILVELGVLAVLVEGLPPQPQVIAFARRLREATFFTRLGHGEGLEDALDAVAALGEEPWTRPLFERLVHARAIARRASSKIDLLYQIRQAESGRDAIALLREHLVGMAVAEAPFWVLRELGRLGVVADLGRVASAIVVPNRALVAAAIAVGLAGRAPTDFAGYLAISEAASRVAGGVEHGYGLALERLSDVLALRS